jgi:hypothetical protein
VFGGFPPDYDETIRQREGGGESKKFFVIAKLFGG